MQVWRRERTTAAWKYLQIIPISSRAALHAFLDEFAAILRAAQFPLPSALVIPSIYSIRFFVEVVQDWANEPRVITLQHRFCTAALWEMSLRVIDVLLTESVVREKVRLLDGPTMGDLYTIDRSIVGQPHLVSTVVEFPTRQTRYYF